MTQITLDVVAAAYTQTRDEIRALEAQIDEKKELQKRREDWMLGELAKQGLQNFKTAHGVTVYQMVKESVTVGDGDAYFDFVAVPAKNELIHELSAIGFPAQSAQELAEGVFAQIRWEFLNKSANKTAVLDFMGDKRENPAPPGVNYAAVRSVGVRSGK